MGRWARVNWDQGNGCLGDRRSKHANDRKCRADPSQEKNETKKQFKDVYQAIIASERKGAPRFIRFICFCFIILHLTPYDCSHGPMCMRSPAKRRLLPSLRSLARLIPDPRPSRLPSWNSTTTSVFFYRSSAAQPLRLIFCRRKKGAFPQCRSQTQFGYVTRSNLISPAYHNVVSDCCTRSLGFLRTMLRKQTTRRWRTH